MSNFVANSKASLQDSLLSIEEEKKTKKTSLADCINKSWDVIAPFWPLKNLIAVNPLQGFENKDFEDALKEAQVYFEQSQLPDSVEPINRETIKWLQVFFDEGQATIKMPFRSQGFYKSWLKLSIYDSKLHGGDRNKIKWLKALPESSFEAIKYCLNHLNVHEADVESFLTLILTTLPGWAAHVKYRVNWQNNKSDSLCPVTKEDYLAIRLIISCLFDTNACLILDWFKNLKKNQTNEHFKLKRIEQLEKKYSSFLLKSLVSQEISPSKSTEAQLVFCIDVRSEPIRRAIESQGNYSTLGFAGFFGIPVQIENKVNKASHASCPVLLKPKHSVDRHSGCTSEDITKQFSGHKKISVIKEIYQSLKYNFLTPFALVESAGLTAGIWMGIKTLSPKFASSFRESVKNKILPRLQDNLLLDNIEFNDQCAYAKSALEMTGLTDNFSSLVVFCGHGSQTENNAYSSILDCGACGGNKGSVNAQILVNILNKVEVRVFLAQKGILIPPSTLFVAALHNTTTDDIQLLLPGAVSPLIDFKIKKLQKDLLAAKKINCEERLRKINSLHKQNQPHEHISQRSSDWSQTRPEWGLAGNACFVIGSRDLTKNLNLEGRSFLHSYSFEQDEDGSILTSILTAPVVVAQWINCQYLFSSIDNVAYGSGSKVTKNITGKLGVMQGNASDLMNGLPLQSLFTDDLEPFHEPLRLLTVITAPRARILKIISENELLEKLAKNGWIHFACIDPETNEPYRLERNLSWSQPCG